MKAAYINSFGGDLDLSLREIAEPSTPAGTEVLVRVHAAGLNRADLLQAHGLYPPPDGISPNGPGLEFAGEIVALGEAVGDWQLGDRVCGITPGEAQAEYLLTDASLIVRIPNRLSFLHAACVPEAFITADDALLTQGELSRGDNVLIHAVGSGVGLAGLQICKNFGCLVIGTSRTSAKLDRCSELGLDSPLLVGGPPLFQADVGRLTSQRGANIILDLVGGAYFEENLKSLTSGGRLILVGLTSGTTASFNLGVVLRKRAKIIGTVLRSRTKEEKAAATANFVRDLIPLFEAGELRPNLDRVFSASEVRSAYEYLASNESFGKVVIEF